MPIHETQIYTPEEIGKILRCDRGRVYEWIRSGWLKGFHTGPESRAWLVTGKSLLALINRLELGIWDD